MIESIKVLNNGIKMRCHAPPLLFSAFRGTAIVCCPVEVWYSKQALPPFMLTSVGLRFQYDDVILARSLSCTEAKSFVRTRLAGG